MRLEERQEENGGGGIQIFQLGIIINYRQEKFRLESDWIRSYAPVVN